MHSLFATRRAFLSTLSAAACLPAFAKKGPEKPPNILLIVAGDLPSGMLSCYGSTGHKTPNIDALARRGVHFQNALASSRGGAIGRATLFTGRTPLQHGLSSPGGSIGANEVLVTDLLSDEGFEVGYVGVWALGNDTQPGHGIHWTYIVQAGDTNNSAFSGGEPVRRALGFLDQQSDS
ncbi:MAG TPA: sulfatase-like hydrolase/transferase, partial [Bryobacteraceae bacterium]